MAIDSIINVDVQQWDQRIRIRFSDWGQSSIIYKSRMKMGKNNLFKYRKTLNFNIFENETPRIVLPWVASVYLPHHPEQCPQKKLCLTSSEYFRI